MERLDTRTGCMPSSVEGGHRGPLLAWVKPMWFLSLGVYERESVPTSPWKHCCFEEESYGLSLAGSQKWWCRSPSWTWRRGETSWLGCPPPPFNKLMASILSWTMKSSHFITILAWCGLVPSCFHTVHRALGSASWQGRHCPPTAAFSCTGWPYHLLAGIRAQNVDLRLDFLLRFHE